MPYRNKQMLRDANGDLIPQYWDVAAGDFKPLTGSDGANDTRVTGSNVVYTTGYNADIDPGTSLEVVSGVDISRFAKVVISFHFDSGRGRFEELGGRVLVQTSRIDSSYTGSTVVDRQLLTMGSGVNRPYHNDPLRGAYQTDILILTGQYLFVEIENPHIQNALLGLRSVVVKGVA